MLFAYSSNAFTRTSLSSALQAIAEIGFDGVEILCDRPHWFPGTVAPGEVDRIAALLYELNLTVSNLNANTATGYYHPHPAINHFEPALTNPDPEMRRWRQQYTIETIRLAAQLNAPCISITSGEPIPGVTRNQASEIMVESLKPICEEAARHNVKIGIEYEPGLIIESAADVMAIMAQVNSPALGVNFDIGHSYLMHEDPEETVQLLAGRIWNVHVEDIKNNIHFHLIPGEGDLPFSRYLSALNRINYQGALTLELYSYPEKPITAGKEGLAYLTSLLNDSRVD